MEELIDDIDLVVDLLNVLKSRYFFLRGKYDTELKSQNENYYASNDLQSFIMLELHLLEYACTYGIYSMTMYATRLRTNLNDNDKDHHFLKLLKDKIRNLIETNSEIKNLSVDSYHNFSSYINSFVVYVNVLNGTNIPDTISLNETNSEKKKNKLLKKISKINMMANIISFLVSDNITDYRAENGRTALNMALKYRTQRSLEYYHKKLNK